MQCSVYNYIPEASLSCIGNVEKLNRMSFKENYKNIIPSTKNKFIDN